MVKNLLLLVVAASFVATSNSIATPSVYQMLAKYNFPPGILPEGIQNYTLNPDGSFDVNLPGECEIDVAGYTLMYESKIQGNIRSMLINELQGVSVNLGINRVGINAVQRDGDQVKFNAGVISKLFPVSNFLASPRCNRGPGFPK